MEQATSSGVSSDVKPALGHAVIYRRLDEEHKEIRLLVVHAGSDADPVRCDLRYTFLGSPHESQAPYETISYAWGDGTMRSQITVQGVKLNVPASAEQALRRMRLGNQTRVLWIDSVCINQDDIHERSQQVAMMAKVYSMSTGNLIWLGEDEGFADPAIKTVQNIYEELYRATDNLANLRQTLYDENRANYWKITRDPLRASVDQFAIEKLCLKPWFSRLWVVQEAALAPQSVCYIGKYAIPLEQILRAAVWLALGGGTDTITGGPGLLRASLLFDIVDLQYGYLSDHARKSGTAASFSSLVERLRNFQAHDPRDHVFALVGLYQLLNQTDNVPKEIRPDYRLHVADVWEGATRYMLRTRKDLSFLTVSYDRLERMYNGDIPTWVPPWNQPFKPDHDALQFDDTGLYADDGEKLAIHGCQERKVLKVKGIILGDISKISNICKLDDDSILSYFQHAEGLVRFASNASDEDMHCMVGSTLSVVKPTKVDYSSYARTGQVYRAYKEYLQSKERLLANHLEDKLREEEDFADFQELIQLMSRNRRCFITICGKFGQGPQTMRVGDMLVILFGCPYPVVLRPVSKWPGDYEFVGMAYVHGIMDGSAVREHRAAGKMDFKFRIR